MGLGVPICASEADLGGGDPNHEQSEVAPVDKGGGGPVKDGGEGDDGEGGERG